MKRQHFSVPSVLFACLLFFSCSQSSDESISMNELHQRMTDGHAPLILDVRSGKEFNGGHIEGAVHIPLKDLGNRLGELVTHQDKEIVVYCHSGRRAKKAEQLLNSSGFKQVKDLAGHYEAWKKAGLPLSKGG